ncbi:MULTISPECIES: hypothetical protein [unclassified Bradyrhizobium]|uniref:hypothetical protein n=1 Tax=unclassified Bradyrhizobium TaxID=2631580 RepID=UPI002916B008|nr:MULTISPECIES: hypothetical protein [unclassified Bradyrhizobium]
MRNAPQLPPGAARAFIRNIRAHHSERDAAKRELIAVLQLRDLENHWPSKLRLNEIKALFEEMRAETKRNA